MQPVLESSENAMPEGATPKRQRMAVEEDPASDTPASSSAQGQRMGVIENEGNGPHPLEQMGMASRALHARDEDDSDDLFRADSLQEKSMAARLAASPTQLMGSQWWPDEKTT